MNRDNASPKRDNLADFCGSCGHHQRYHAGPCTICDCPERRPW